MIKLDSGRQEVITARVSFTFGTGADVATQAAFPAIQVPQGAIILGGYIYVSDATSASVTAAIGDGITANRYLTANAIPASTGLVAIVPTGYQYLTQDTIDVTIAGADPVAAGVAELVVRYLRVKRAEFSQG